MANSFIGKAISLLSHSDVRYRGILAGLDPSNSTIQLQNVYSMGTENRRPPDEYIPPADLPYQFIIFRASEVKDIALDNEPMPTRVRSVHDDPAVIGASGPPISNGTHGQYPVPAQNGVTPPPPPPQQVPATLGQRPPVVGVPQPVAGQGAQVQPGQTGEQQQPKQCQSQPSTTTASGRTSSNSRRANNGSVANATASIEKVERAISEVRLSNMNARSKKHGGGQQNQQHSELTVPKTDFDFQSSNARFDKAALASQASAGAAATGAGVQGRIDDESDTNTNPSEDGNKAAAANKSPTEKAPSYNPKKSFFDNLSSSASSAPPSGVGGGGRGRGRGGAGKSRREEEREKNVATFGEPGGVGLMGPGAYVGGYGHGRRGGRGARRGGGGRRNPSGANQHQQ